MGEKVRGDTEGKGGEERKRKNAERNMLRIYLLILLQL